MKCFFTALLILLLAISTVTCYYPPFLSETASSLAIISKMNEYAKIGPLNLPEGYDSYNFVPPLFFIPEKDGSKNGFAVLRNTGCIQVWYIENTAGNSIISSMDQACFGGDGSDQGVVMDTVSGPLGFLFVATFSRTSAYTFVFNHQMGTSNLIHNSFSLKDIISSNFSGSYPGFDPTSPDRISINGACLSNLPKDAIPSPTPTFTPTPTIGPTMGATPTNTVIIKPLYLYVLFNDGSEDSTDDYFEGVFMVNVTNMLTPPLNTALPVRSSFTLSGTTQDTGTYCYDPLLKRSTFVLTYSGNSHRLMIDSGNNITDLPGTANYQSVLSSSILYGKSGSTGYFMDKNFGQISKFPIGNTVFLSEMTINSTDLVLFSRGDAVMSNYSPIEYYFYVYSMPVARLGELNY